MAWSSNGVCIAYVGEKVVREKEYLSAIVLISEAFRGDV